METATEIPRQLRNLFRHRNQLMISVIDNVAMLVVVIVLAIPVAIIAIRLAEKSLKKQVALLNK